jgi:hypothetical protein
MCYRLVHHLRVSYPIKRGPTIILEYQLNARPGPGVLDPAMWQGHASCLEPVVAAVEEVDAALGGNGAVLSPSGGLEDGLDHGLDDVELVRGDRDGGLGELERGGVGGHAL